MAEHIPILFDTCSLRARSISAKTLLACLVPIRRIVIRHSPYTHPPFWFGKRWRADARKSLVALGLEPPSLTQIRIDRRRAPAESPLAPSACAVTAGGARPQQCVTLTLHEYQTWALVACGFLAKDQRQIERRLPTRCAPILANGRCLTLSDPQQRVTRHWPLVRP